MKRKVLAVEICPEAILDAIRIPKSGRIQDGRVITISENPIPETAKALRCAVNERGNVVLVMGDESFDEVELCESIPIATPTYAAAELHPASWATWKKIFGQGDDIELEKQIEIVTDELNEA